MPFVPDDPSDRPTLPIGSFFVLDGRGRVVVYDDGTARQVRYDAQGRVLDLLDGELRFVPDDLGNPLRVQWSQRGWGLLTYDEERDLVVDSDGHVVPTVHSDDLTEAIRRGQATRPSR
jgi:hypothetical protein